MPTDLTFRLAARNAIFRHLEATRGPGRWGTSGMQDYSAQRATGADPFNWFRIHPLFPKGADFPFDHAVVGETALMLAPAPGTVDMDRVQDRGQWYTETASQATAALGEKGVQIALAHLRGGHGIVGCVFIAHHPRVKMITLPHRTVAEASAKRTRKGMPNDETTLRTASFPTCQSCP